MKRISSDLLFVAFEKGYFNLETRSCEQCTPDVLIFLNMSPGYDYDPEDKEYPELGTFLEQVLPNESIRL